jgi:hypothetical protein
MRDTRLPRDEHGRDDAIECPGWPAASLSVT